MNPVAIIKGAQADGVMLMLSPTGSIMAIGGDEAVCRWLPIIREHKPGLLAELRKTPEQREILAWLNRIGETDPAVIRETLAKCDDNPDALRFFLGLARGETIGALH
jgi:hypothetical protein